MEATSIISGKPLIRRKIAISETLGTIPEGITARFARIDFAVKEKSLAATITKLNMDVGRKEFSYDIDPKTADILITRK